MLITIPAINLPGWQFGGTTAELRIYALQTFRSGTNRIVAGSYPNESWYQKVNCTISGTTLQVPEIQLDSTTNSDTPNAQYVCVLLDYRKNVREFFLSGSFRVPTSFGDSVHWEDLRIYARARAIRLPEMYLTADQCIALIQSTLGELDFAVTSVNGQVGAVVLDTDDISEGATNKYFTNTRAQNALSGSLTTLQNNINSLGASVDSDINNLQSQIDNIEDTLELVVDWDEVQNKPPFGTAALLDVPETGNASSTQVVKGNDSRFLPPGGTAHQILEKVNNANYNVQWVDAPAGTGGATGEIPFEDDAGADDNIPLVGGSGGGGGGGAVDSVNGQDGAVVLDTDDISEGVTNQYHTPERAQDAVGAALTDTATIDFTYTDGSNQITADVKDASIGDAKLVAGINANKIGGGAVSNAEFAHLDGVTSAIQTQIDSKQASLGFTPENSANKNQNNGYAGLDSSGLIPSALLPSFVDDVLEYANFAALPGTGVTGKIYVTLDNNKTFRWSGSAYVEISASPGSTDSVTEGSVNFYFTVARVLAAVLTGLSTASSAVISASDTVLGALGKLQAQITAYKDAALTFTNKTISGSNNTFSNIPNSAITGLGSLATLSAVGTSQITDANVTTAKLADANVTTVKVADGAITPKKRAVITALTNGVAVDARLSEKFRLLSTSSSPSVVAPTNPTDGQTIIIAYRNISGSSQTLSLQTGVSEGFQYTDVVTGLTATPNDHTDLITAVFDSHSDRWLVCGYAKG